MSRLASRIAALEAKRKANEQPEFEYGIFAGQPLYTTDERDGVLYCLPLHTTEEFAAMALRQQSDLMTRLTEYDAAIDAEEVDERPVAVGADDQIAPGHVRPNFIFRMEGGKEIQIDTRDGTRTVL